MLYIVYRTYRIERSRYGCKYNRSDGWKGGAAKTTLSLLLAQALGNAGYKTCAGDLDGQCNLTTAAGVNEDEQEGIYSVLKKK